MDTSKLSTYQLAEARVRLCQLYLQDDGQIPGGLWSWKVYVDGDVRHRGPGSTRKDPLKWYATLPHGEHRIVIRELDHTKPKRTESNTFYFTVKDELTVIIKVQYVEGRIVLGKADTGSNSTFNSDAQARLST